MKKAMIFLMVLAAVGMTSAKVYLTNNGDFESPIGPGEGWDIWAGGPVAGHEWTSGGNPGQYVSLENGDAGWAGWYNAGGIGGELNVLGIPAKTTITFSADMKSISGVLNAAGLKAESWNNGSVGASAEPLFTITTSWETYSINYTLTSDATRLLCSLMNLASDVPGSAHIAYDNACVGVAGRTIQPALRPVPTVGNTSIAPSSDVLSWTNPDPNTPEEPILCDVWFRESATELADPNLVPEQPGAQKIASAEAINSVDLSELSTPIALQADYYYYWKVNIIDPNDGNPAPIEGFTWWFQIGDAAPTNVSAGTDQYVWLTMDDGTPADGKVTFTLTGSYTDDGKSAVTTTWQLDTVLTQTDPLTEVTIANPSVNQGTKTSGTHATSVTIDNTGWFFFNFTATDTAGSVVDTVNVGVYASACEAANQDPTDIPAKYPNGHGDIDGDCDIDLSDFAIMAGTWLDCMSTKLGCI